MHIFLRLATILTGGFFLASLHGFARSFLPAPINALHIIVAVAIAGSIAESRRLMATAAVAMVFAELFSSAPFGIALVALALSLQAERFLAASVVSTRTWYTALVLGLLGTIIYQIFLLLGVSVATLLKNSILTYTVEKNFLWETVLTGALAGLGFTLVARRRARKHGGGNKTLYGI